MFVLPTVTAPAASQTGHHGGVVGGNEIRQHSRPASGEQARRAENVLVCQGHAGQCRYLTGSASLVGGFGLGQGALLGHRDEAVQRFIGPNPLKTGFCQLHAGKVPAAQAPIQIGQRAEWLHLLDDSRYQVQTVFGCRGNGLEAFAIYLFGD